MIKVIDGIMSVGKTEYAIDIINKDEVNSIIYITPYLDEVERIKHSCKSKNFITPDEGKMGTKTRHFKYLLSAGRNIVATHSLFKGVDEEFLELLQARNYILILDEVLDVVEPLTVSKKDLKEILERYAHIDDSTKELVWDDMEYKGNHYEIMQMAINGSLTVVNNVVLLWNFPIEVFKAFKESYILTYMFDSQINKFYFDYYDVKYKKYSLDREGDKSVLVEYGKSKYEHEKKKLINKNLKIYEGGLNSIGDKDYSLSKTWFEKNKENELIKSLRKNLYTYFKNNTKTKSMYNGWTTFKVAKKFLSGKGYTRGFIPINMRASNNYNHKNSMAYIGNRYINPFVKLMFNFRDVNVDEDMWALSEMLQWIWRGSIRRDEVMNIYIPSKRMRELLINWIGDGQNPRNN